MDFVAIDFETANHRPDSPCQLAAVVVERGEIVDEKCWLIRPQRLYFSPRCIAVHGILPEQVRDQPEWSDLWSEIASYLDGKVVIAHNAGFDLRVLSATCETYELACPQLEYSCTRLIARRTWPGRSGYGLRPTADALGFTFRHHDALEDSRVCAKIALAAAEKSNASSFDELEEKLAITRGRLRMGIMTGPRSIRRSRRRVDVEVESSPSPRRFRRDGWPEPAKKAQQRRASVENILQQSGEELPLRNRSVVLNGSLLGLDREDAVLFLERLGARVQPRLNMETDYLIVGHATQLNLELEQDPATTPMHIPEREQDVLQRQRQGQPIRILSQRQLLALVPGGLEVARSIAGQV